MERLSERLSPDVGLRCWLALGISWSRSEDETIVRSVSELGNKWAKIVAGLSSRGMRVGALRVVVGALRETGSPLLVCMQYTC